MQVRYQLRHSPEYFFFLTRVRPYRRFDPDMELASDWSQVRRRSLRRRQAPEWIRHCVP